MVTVSARLDTIIVDELEQYIVNDKDLSKDYNLILKGFIAEINKGEFDKNKAIKSLIRLVNDGATKYQEDYGKPGDKWQRVFPMAERKAVAESLINTFLMENNMDTTAIDKSKETGNLTTKSASMPIVTLHTKGQLNFQSVNMSAEMAKLLAELQAKKDITSKHDKMKNEVIVECKNDKIYQDIMRKSNALSSKSSEDSEEFNFMSLADETDNAPLKSTNCKLQDDLLSKANDLGLTRIIASEISEKTGGLISKFGKLNYDETKKAIESGKYKGDELDFLAKKLAGMDRMKSGEMAGRGPSSKAMETIAGQVLFKKGQRVEIDGIEYTLTKYLGGDKTVEHWAYEGDNSGYGVAIGKRVDGHYPETNVKVIAMGTLEDEAEEKVSDVIPIATSFADEKSVKDIIPQARNF